MTNPTIIAIENLFDILTEKITSISDVDLTYVEAHGYWKELWDSGGLDAVRGKEWCEDGKKYHVNDDLTVTVMDDRGGSLLWTTAVKWGAYVNGLRLGVDYRHESRDNDPETKEVLEKLLSGHSCEDVNPDGIPFSLVYHLVRRTNGSLYPLPIVLTGKIGEEEGDMSPDECSLLRAQLINWAL